MTSNGAAEPSLIMDVRGLKSWASLSPNEAGAIKDLSTKGQIVVLTATWNEFREAYPQLCIKIDIGERTRVTNFYRSSAAQIADTYTKVGLNSSIEAGDFDVAGVAKLEDLKVVTTAAQRSRFYDKIDVDAITIDEILQGG